MRQAPHDADVIGDPARTMDIEKSREDPNAIRGNGHRESRKDPNAIRGNGHR
jgi:hypothetical protein